MEQTKDGDIDLWRCPNCGQTHFADHPPDMCDFCGDFTTWQRHHNGQVRIVIGKADNVQYIQLPLPLRYYD